MLLSYIQRIDHHIHSFLPLQTCEPFRNKAPRAVINLWILLICPKSKTYFFIPKTNIPIYNWFPWNNYLPMHISLMYGKACWLPQIFWWTSAPGLGVWVSKDVECEFSHSGYSCSSGPFGWDSTLYIFMYLCFSIHSSQYISGDHLSPRSHVLGKAKTHEKGTVQARWVHTGPQALASPRPIMPFFREDTWLTHRFGNKQVQVQSSISQPERMNETMATIEIKVTRHFPNSLQMFRDCPFHIMH